MRIVTEVFKKKRVINLIVSCDHCQKHRVEPPCDEQIIKDLECPSCGKRGNLAEKDKELQAVEAWN